MFLAILLLLVMLVGSPLAGFGCQTLVPEQFQFPCETNLLETAVQANFLLLLSPLTAIAVPLSLVFHLAPTHRSPQQLYLLPPSPPPRSIVS